jgi:hypothetical protein
VKCGLGEHYYGANANDKPRAPGLSHSIGTGRPRKAGLGFGANRNEFDERAEDVHEEVTALVTAVEAHLLTEQTGRNTDSAGIGGRLGVVSSENWHGSTGLSVSKNGTQVRHIMDASIVGTTHCGLIAFAFCKNGFVLQINVFAAGGLGSGSSRNGLPGELYSCLEDTVLARSRIRIGILRKL